MGRSDPLTSGRARALPLAVAGLVLYGIATTATTASPTTGPSAAAPPGSAVARSAQAAPTSGTPRATAAAERPAPGPARQGTRAASQVDRYAPAALILPGKARAEVVSVATVDGELQVPQHVDRLGWWDGSSWLGDPYGATVVAGHVDSAREGLGFFAQLLRIRVGERVTVLGAKGQRQTYEVASVRTVAQNALADDGQALDQTGDHRLVLITCTGPYTPGRGYASNLVVTAKRV